MRERGREREGCGNMGKQRDGGTQRRGLRGPASNPEPCQTYTQGASAATAMAVQLPSPRKLPPRTAKGRSGFDTSTTLSAMLLSCPFEGRRFSGTRAQQARHKGGTAEQGAEVGKGGGCAYCIAASERAMEGGKEGRGDRGEWDAGVEALAWVGPVAGVYLVLEAKVAKCAAHGNRRD